MIIASLLVAAPFDKKESTRRSRRPRSLLFRTRLWSWTTANYIPVVRFVQEYSILYLAGTSPN